MIIHIVAPFAVVIPSTGLSSVSGGDPNSGIINIMQTALAKNNKNGNPRLNYFKKEIAEGNLEYIDTKRVLLNNIPQRDSRGVNLSPTAVISNTLAKSITKILYNVKTEKDLAKLKAGNLSYYQEGKQIEKGRI